ncbi:MAG TPA: DUF308 domain-containing protein [Bacillota bacterium]|jgi:uncharacterized membrane protein HdeD (DUF308 family)|nr:DUF308 domain-containing protein [Bacillota bacterium]
METVQRFKTAFIIISVLFILLGITLIIWPEFSLLTICKLCGVITLLLGLVRVIVYFRRDAFENLFRADLAQGLIFLLLAGFMLFAPKAVVSVIPVILGLVILIDSILRIQLSVELKRLHQEKWWLSLILALLTAVLGTLLLFNPFAGSVVLTIFIGIALTINGAVNLWGILFFTKTIKGRFNL